MGDVSQSVGGADQSNHSSLKILIVGAGIGGLSAAIALRKQGHDVEVFESSRFATETGAAIHMPPNSNGLLKRLGISAIDTGANECEGMVSWAANGAQLAARNFGGAANVWQHPWVLAHRVRLHNTLKDTALSTTSVGTPVKLSLSTPVVDVDPVSATVHFKDGSSAQGDVLIGADGVHSVTRTRLPSPSNSKKAFGSGKSAFRFLVPRQALLDDPATSKYVDTDGIMHICYGRDRRIVMYPTSNNTLMNFVAIHPESETESAATGDWNNAAPKEMLLSVYKTFPEDWTKILSKADNESLKVWKLLDMELLDTWTNERMALLGDAAHPFLPHQGQGGGQAVEDAVALGVVLERGLTVAEVPARLKLYEQIRKQRAETIQHYSRVVGQDQMSPQEAAKVMLEFTNFNYGHDEFDYATQRLREWKWAQEPRTYWRMPKVFGPMPGPRQNFESQPRDGTNSTFTTASIKIKTSRTVLQNLFPSSKNWRFKSPGTVAYCSFSQTTLNKMQWLGGSGYNHLGLYIHGVEYVKQDGTTVNGTYMPILFEDFADPIISGREELGMPKLYSAIDVERDNKSYHIRASWRGMTWGRFELNNLEESTGQANESSGKIAGDTTDEGILVHRYVPAVGREKKGEADAEYAVFDAFSEARPTPQPQRSFKTTNASVTLNARDWSALPTIHHVIDRLAEIPVYEVVSAQVIEGVGVPDVSSAKRIE